MKLHTLALSIATLILPTFGGTVLLANETAPEGAQMVGLANELSEGGAAPEWITIPFGNHDHAQGLQVFDRNAAEEMANEFNSVASKAARIVGFGGLPCYVGHPDHPAFANEYKDKRAVGWVKEVKVGAQGLELKMKWNTRGTDMIANEDFKFFSPNWAAKPVTGKTKQYRPFRLKSLGLTNEPNIGVAPLHNANERQDSVPAWIETLVQKFIPAQLANEKGDGLTAWLQAQIALPTEQMEAPVKTAIEEICQANTRIETLTTEKTTADTARTAAEEARTTAETALANERTALANERKERATLLIANAVRENRVPAAEVTAWEGKFAADFTKALTDLGNAKRAVLPPPGARKTEKLGQRKEEASGSNRLAELANERMEKTGEDFTAAWLHVKKDPANAALLQAKGA